MTQARRVSQQTKVMFRIILISGCIGVAIGVSWSDEPITLPMVLLSGLVGMLIGTGSTLVEIYVFSTSRIARKLPPLAMMVLRGAILCAIILTSFTIPTILVGETAPWHDPDFVPVFAVSALVSFAFSTVIEIMRLLGREATFALVFGRYTRPRLEKRVVLFADLVGSTALAEKIGELRFHECLRDVMLDLSTAIDAARGDVHRYVGDAVIVTWPLEVGVSEAACLSCAEQMHAELIRRQDFYLSTYGIAPRIRIALHCGQLAAGEIGDWKKEIALLGDTMNTTARLEDAARTFQVSTVLSDDLRRKLPPAQSADLVRLPDFAAHGKEKHLALWTRGQVS